MCLTLSREMRWGYGGILHSVCRSRESQAARGAPAPRWGRAQACAATRERLRLRDTRVRLGVRVFTARERASEGRAYMTRAVWIARARIKGRARRARLHRARERALARARRTDRSSAGIDRSSVLIRLD